MIFFQVSSSNLPFILDPQLFIIALFKVSIQPTEVLASFHKLSVAGALSLPWPTQSTSPWETLSTATPRGSGNPASFTLGAGAILAAVSMVIALFTGSHANELTTWPRCIMQCKHCWYCQTSIKKKLWLLKRSLHEKFMLLPCRHFRNCETQTRHFITCDFSHDVCKQSIMRSCLCLFRRVHAHPAHIASSCTYSRVTKHPDFECA